MAQDHAVPSHTMKVIISGGGTGGHIYPAIAMADALKKCKPKTDILFVGAIGKMEMTKVPEAGYPIVGLGIRGFQRKQIWKNGSLPFRLAASLWRARRLLKDFKPDVVIGTGGYASTPVLYMATQQKIATLIQEQNATAGLANRILARYVDTVCVAYPNMDTYFPSKKIVHTGNPIRADLMQLENKREAARAHFGLDANKKCLLVLGGSLGSKTINKSILGTIDRLIEADLQVIWVAGRLYFEDIKTQLKHNQQSAIKIFPFIKSMDLAYAAADIVVSRAGALAIAELCMAQKPVIFVPSSNVVADHQTQNVWPLVEKKAALVIEDDKAIQTLGQDILKLLRSEAQQKLLARNIKDWAMPKATTTIVKAIMRLAQGPTAESERIT